MDLPAVQSSSTRGTTGLRLVQPCLNLQLLKSSPITVSGHYTRPTSKFLSHSTTICCSGCGRCGYDSKGQLTCCGKGGSWRGKCGPPGNAKFEHTWNDGFEACAATVKKVGMASGSESEMNHSQSQRLMTYVVSANTRVTTMVTMILMSFLMFVSV